MEREFDDAPWCDGPWIDPTDEIDPEEMEDT